MDNHCPNILNARGKGRIQCALDRNMALRFLGYSGQSVNDGLTERFESLAKRCEQANEALFTWQMDQFAISEDGVVLRQCGLHLPGKECARHLKDAKYVALAALTLGQGCEQELRQMKALNTLDFLMYDACASALTEAAANVLHDMIAAKAQENGLFAHARFSPGYGDLPLSVQPAFLDAVNARRGLGLTTTNNHFLIPTKSITAIIGLFNDEETDDGESPCAICPALDYCSFRERGLTCHGKRL